MTATISTRSSEWLAGASVADEVRELRPDYAALLVVAQGLPGGDSDPASDALLRRAEEAAAPALVGGKPEEIPHVAQWRETFRAFGAKPQRTRNSLEALLRRTSGGLPRINRLTDVYNAVSVLHQVPVGGENLDAYAGSARLVRATGEETFDTVAGGEPVVEHPEPGEVVWRDDVGVTCRRWNWRQCRRTQLTADTRNAMFILDGLSALGTDGLVAAGEEMVAQLHDLGPDVRTATRLLPP